MKVVAKPIEVVAWFNKEGIPHPVRFKVSNDEDSFKVIKIDRIEYRQKEKLAGNEMILFKCQSTINGLEMIYEIKYELGTCRWMLYKI